LVWLLIRRLALRLPTALQIDDSEVFLFHEGGTSLFQGLKSVSAYLGLNFSTPSSKIWVLIDSSAMLLEPAPVFRKRRPFFVVEAASRLSRFEWGKKVFAKYFCMKTWSFSEVLQMYVTPPSGVHNAHCFCSRPYLGLSSGGPHDESRLRYLYDNYRASPRELGAYAPVPEEFEGLVLAQVQQMLPDTLRRALQAPDSDESSHLITRAEPSSTARFLTKKTIASPGAFKLLWNEHLKHQVSDTAYFYNIFQSGGSITASAAGWIFEFRMHELLTQGYLINLFPLRLRSTNERRKFDVYDKSADSYERNFQLAASSEYPLDRGINLELDRYYRPEARNFPTIDSLPLIRPINEASPILLMFQMTRSQDGHGVEEAGLEIINGLMFPPGTRMYYVVVTPLGTEPQIRVPTGCFQDVHVFHHPVHPNTLFPSNIHLQPPTATLSNQYPAMFGPSSSQTVLDNSESLPHPLPSTSNRPNASESAPQIERPSGKTEDGPSKGKGGSRKKRKRKT
jgi:hypothetical protein